MSVSHSQAITGNMLLAILCCEHVSTAVFHINFKVQRIYVSIAGFHINLKAQGIYVTTTDFQLESAKQLKVVSFHKHRSTYPTNVTLHVFVTGAEVTLQGCGKSA